MPFQYINELLDLPEAKIVNVKIDEYHAVIELTPVDHIQACPYCHSSQVIRNGVSSSSCFWEIR